MSTLREIEAAANALPREEQEELLRFLATRLRITPPHSTGTTSSQRGFPISSGRKYFTSEDVARAEESAESER